MTVKTSTHASWAADEIAALRINQAVPWSTDAGKLSPVRPDDLAGEVIAEVVKRNQEAVDSSLDGLHRVELPGRITSDRELLNRS